MSLLIFLIALAVSLIVVRIGGLVFELTGLEPSIARFQALSCFSGTGFTTKASEVIVNNAQRRRIASVLIILGHAGFLTMIAAFASYLGPERLLPNFKIPILDVMFPSYLMPWVDLLVIALAVYFTYRIFVKSKISQKFSNYVIHRFIKKRIIKSVAYEEFLFLNNGCGVASIDVTRHIHLKDKSFSELEMEYGKINVLAIERENVTISKHANAEKLMFGDRVICFGDLEKIRKVCK